MKFRTQFTAKAEVVKPNSNEFKAIASSLKDRYGFELKPQMDLLYTRACLVSAGERVGINENDDIFTREEAWAARHTPVLKPMNWQHKDHDILGVIYTVQAKDINGNVLDISDDTVPDCDFDLWIESAIFSLIHADRAEEIETRSKAGKLYVSMEAWFDDYNYGFYDKNTAELDKVVARNQNTSFLDGHLRAGGGAGVYHDPESDREVRIGRVLRSITFGGCGFVDRPANKRSVIDEAEPMAAVSAERDIETQITRLLEKVIKSYSLEELEMNMQARANQTADGSEVVAAVESALEKREKAAAEKKEREQLIARANEAEVHSAELQSKIDAITEANKEKDTQVEALNVQVAEYGQIVDEFLREQTAAGATGNTPAEIAAIDAAQGGEAAFKAKLAWIGQSMAALKARAARADELESALAEAEAVVREQDVRTLLGESLSEDALEIFVAHAAQLGADEYQRWRDEKELMVIELTATAAAKEEEVPFPPKKGKKEVKPVEKEACANVFEALLAKRKSESGAASPETPTDMGHLIGHPGGEGVKSGVGPEALRTPRHKIAGSTAGNDPAKKLETAQAEGGVQLAGAQASGEGDDVESPFRTLAKLVVDEVKEDDTKDQKRSDFDPVQ